MSSDQPTTPRPSQLTAHSSPLDYRNDPNHGQAGDPPYTPPGYDTPLDAANEHPTPPFVDRSIKSYDLVDDAQQWQWDQMDAGRPAAISGASPDLYRAIDWERSGRGGGPPQGD
jgi:hypothetical protein